MKQTLVVSLLFLCGFANAQFSVRLVVTDVATRKQDDIYVSGNFNSWNPKDENYKLKPFGGSRRGIVLKDLPAGSYAFKFTRGDMSKVESTADGRDIPDRILEVNADLSQDFVIPGWKDDYPEKPRPYTASPQVRIIDTAFKIPQLNRTRKIWVYLPKGYATSSKIYPVLYMHDGQNLFNEQTASSGEWGVDEALDTLQQQLNKECIIVGIDSDKDKRATEYNPYDDVQNGKGEGKEYLDFIVTILKPFIDGKYKTRKGPENTFIAGSSRGGFISFYAMMKYPHVFSAAGVFSPSFGISPQVFADAEAYTPAGSPRFYMYAGKQEPENMVPDMEKMIAILEKKQGVFSVRKVIDPLGRHNEKTWRGEFDDFYRWLMN